MKLGSRCILQPSFRAYSTVRRRTRTRFAPSPTGPFHVGGLRTALVNFLLARRDGGDFILRIEDTDQSRCSVDALKGIFDGLDWAGMTPDEGPVTGGLYGSYVQSERSEIYRKYADHLLQTGRAYRCFCSHERLEILKNEQRRSGEKVRYDNRCRHLSNREIELNLSQNLPYVLRFKMLPSGTVFRDLVFGEINFPNADYEGDPVIMKSDGLPVYHLANVVDDHLMEISHVVRGSEWITSIPKHLQLYAAFDWHPPAFAHLPLMLSSSGRKFSKRHVEQESVALVESLRREGHLPSALLTWLSATGGLLDFAPSIDKKHESGTWTPAKRVEEMLHLFDLSSLNRHHARVDPELLQVCGRAHFDRLIEEAFSRRSLRRPTIVEYLRDYLNTYPPIDDDCSQLMDLINDEERLIQVLARLKGRIGRLSDLTSVSSAFGFLWKSPNPEIVKSSLSGSIAIYEAILMTAVKLERSEELSEDDLRALLQSVNKLSGLPKAEFLTSLRICLTGSDHGMPIHELVQLLTPMEAAKRIREAGKVIEK
ncbi:glutamyl tRNA synthetase [Echinococcus multilocularis]|uniref:Nondiscriminating glutamyl-tRNA synthetase EARS2, mitochondrial n=1 Tax=Echinococcus multilocularis TaxID=6211 RepID=A0A068YD78_ECHMU|nr:glutamyl tRNA synthetase [Echinococcus multilocularis]